MTGDLNLRIAIFKHLLNALGGGGRGGGQCWRTRKNCLSRRTLTIQATNYFIRIPPLPSLLLLLLSSLNTTFSGWLAAVFLKHHVTARDLRCPRICEGFWPYPVSTLSAMNSNDMKHQSMLTTFLYLSRQFLMPQLCLVPQLLCAISRSVSTPA